MFRGVRVQAANNGPYAQLVVSACRAIRYWMETADCRKAVHFGAISGREDSGTSTSTKTFGNNFLGAFISQAGDPF